MNNHKDIAAGPVEITNDGGNVLGYTVTMPVSTTKATVGVHDHDTPIFPRGYVQRICERYRHTFTDTGLASLTVSHLLRRNHV